MALLTVLFALLALPCTLLFWTAQSLSRNRAKAKATGLPYLERWVSPMNPLWLLCGSSLVRLFERFGIASDNFSRIYSFGWEANARAQIHENNSSDVLLVVSPGGLQLVVADARVAYDILQRRTDFRRNMEEMAIMNVYGKNLVTTDDQEWRRHRKMTGVTFTEKNNELVWKQSLIQGKGMLKYWTERCQMPIRSVQQDSKILTLNVLAAALFNKLYSFEGPVDAKETRHKADESADLYRASLSTILRCIIEIFIVGEKRLQAWWTPKSWKAAGEAIINFRSYVVGLMEEERAYMKQGQTDHQHLVARLVRALDAAEKASETEGADAVNMTHEEIVSNLFVYAVAGNDTTAITLTNLIIHMASNQESQDWISEELNHYLPSSDPESWSYDTFKKLKRCNAVIMETLRLCHPLSQLVKTTGPTPQPLTINTKTYIIPPETSVHCTLAAMHSLRKYWGPNPLAWNPKQHITTTTTTTTFEAEVLASDTSDHFMPWAWGQRACPGKRFSQVELVAVLATLFRDWRVDVEPEEGEGVEEARRRAWVGSLVVDHQGKMLHEMLDSQQVGLVWVRR
ncbi:cytochrome P450 [Decorospora gaudefroyi]|uniref:Cytochrome P450 n=1 Tax=Decorospora gaudefroyi TaxID=184978 RepID=A0A6A5KC31_9PLEO|nr:cytochrome P450 [Decorospora gaudefroyi]